MPARTVPASSTQAPGNLITGALWNAGPAASNTFLTTVPFAQVYQAAAQSVPDNAFTALAMDTTVKDDDGTHSNVTNNSRITCQVAGWYLVEATAGFSANATGNRAVAVYKNAAAIEGATQSTCVAVPSIQTVVSCRAEVPLAVGDYVEAYGYQTSGGALNAAATTGQRCGLSALWIRT